MDTRLIQDLEFLQMLANPDYIFWLVELGLLTDDSFLAYLEYLRYCKEPEYSHLLVFPFGLSMLELLLDGEVRKKLVEEPELSKTVLSSQIYPAWLNS